MNLGSVANRESGATVGSRRRRSIVGVAMNILVVDIGGTNVKCLASGQRVPRKFPSGPQLTPQKMVSEVKQLTADWQYDVVALGYPGLVVEGRPAREPHNLRPGWLTFNFERAFGCKVRIINDAVMQALGSYEGGRMLFLGLGTGLGSTLIVNGVVQPMELGHLSYKKGTVEDYVGALGLKRLGRKKWEKHVMLGIERLMSALLVDDVVIGGGNAKKLRVLPAGCRLGSNANAFVGGFRIWQEAGEWESSNVLVTRVGRGGEVEPAQQIPVTH